ncbi:uncharacterized protein LOC128991131 [Macrosteles quadrilineatus]|uniref:uncharacterized protein LOC128991131 n=1 Tax=Macrosteles quadrilineatus TaxID=74068 RepID=UPI0023E2F180|nr:uncharacterized protein LOC128991131 [Macrosteles quadrilineatus]
MVTTSNCCFCFSVRTGALIIGWVETVFGIFDVAAKITVMSTGQQIQLDSPANDISSNITLMFLEVLVAIALLYGVYTYDRTTVHFYIFLHATLIVSKIIMLIVLLFYAAFTFHFIMWEICGIFTQIYVVVVVYSYYKEMEEHEAEPWP